MKDIHMNNLIPLHLKPTEYNPELNGWINNLVHGMKFCLLKTEDWSKEHKFQGNFI